jgi:ubiquinone/menaquinone biosynthesis C-methylase UbiE
MRLDGMLANPAERFTGRVESYRRYRPRYPAEIVALLRRECGLSGDAALADVAAGTGLLAEIFLAAGFAVTAVEPNAEMRAACLELEQSHPRLQVIAGTAEATGLPDSSVDLITVAQAMHWFNLQQTRREFTRVMKPGGWCAVVYNNRHMGGDAFHDAYEEFSQEFGTDYSAVKEQHMGRKRMAQFFAPSAMQSVTFANAQALALEAFAGRILSSSYIPRPGHPRFEKMQKRMEKLFAEHQSAGVVTIQYDCVVCYGQLEESA